MKKKPTQRKREKIFVVENRKKRWSWYKKKGRLKKNLCSPMQGKKRKEKKKKRTIFKGRRDKYSGTLVCYFSFLCHKTFKQSPEALKRHP